LLILKSVESAREIDALDILIHDHADGAGVEDGSFRAGGTEDRGGAAQGKAVTRAQKDQRGQDLGHGNTEVPGGGGIAVASVHQLGGEAENAGLGGCATELARRGVQGHPRRQAALKDAPGVGPNAVDGGQGGVIGGSHQASGGNVLDLQRGTAGHAGVGDNAVGGQVIVTRAAVGEGEGHAVALDHRVG